jgi:hypothetical protein
VTGGKQRAGAGQDDHPDLVVAFRFEEGVTELNQETSILGVSGLNPVEGDAGDLAVIQGLVVDVLSGHDSTSSSQTGRGLGV